VLDCVADDVSDVLVAQPIDDLAPATARGHQVRGTQDAQVLADERLGDAEGVDEVVDAALAVGELEQDGHAYGGSKGSEELRCFIDA
jgi:hypothetical protein